MTIIKTYNKFHSHHLLQMLHLKVAPPIITLLDDDDIHCLIALYTLICIG